MRSIPQIYIVSRVHAIQGVREQTSKPPHNMAVSMRGIPFGLDAD